MRWKPSIVVTLIAALTLAGCAAKKKLSADEYFTQATNDFETGAYQLAAQEYRDLLDQYPFNDHGEEAEFRIAQAHFLQGNMAEAIAAFTDFQRRHPTSPQLPFVGYALGLCYARQMRTIDRDQSAAQNASNYFATVIQQYPNSPFAELAREQMAHCQSSLAAHELYIAEFYTARDNKKAAEMRLLDLLGRYNKTTEAADALSQLAQIYREDHDPARAALADAALAQNFPRTPWAERARHRLEQLGHDPTLLAGDPLSQLLAGIPQPINTATAPPVQVPGLDADHRGSTYAPGVPALAPPAPFGRTRY
jgi:outer membrane protein assembly factor BamD